MKKLFILLISLYLSVFGQSTEFFPSDMNVHHFKANFLEARMGTAFELNQNNLRLDIGNSREIIHWKKSPHEIFGLGADFFTFTKLRGEKDFHFPVDAVDYLFGINFTYKKSEAKSSLGGRLRLSHISAHFVDGHFNGTSGSWRDGRNPIVYSREFFELLGFYSFQDYRFYAGGTYLFHTTPENIGKSILQFGSDGYPLEIIKDMLYVFYGVDFKFFSQQNSESQTEVALGVKFGKKYSPGKTLYFKYFNGTSIHGEYFDVKENHFSFVFNIEI